MTITINNDFINQNYTQCEIQAKFEDFLLKENLIDKLELYEISISDVPKNTQNRFRNIDKINFVNY